MLARITVARRIPRAFVAHYSVRPTAGSVAQSKPLNAKEKAHEDQYVHQHEMEQLSKLKKQIEMKKKELDDLEKERVGIENGAGKQ